MAEVSPWESRQFKIDQDFYPISHASGGRPDLIFEFLDMVLVVEVTLTSSSRQEAAEGEPVRRHVAKYAEEYLLTGKDVFGLFIAINIDTNTANTFRLGEWYMKDDRKINLHIVPVCLEDFGYLFSRFAHTPSPFITRIKDFLVRCRMENNRDAPDWKKFISQLIHRF
ncbi:MAG: AlwI family type II restriction endonuclease [Neisseriaceae bacterium]